jgi:hypothetical protein
MKNGNRAAIAFMFLATAALLAYAGALPQAAAQALFSQDLTLHETTSSPGMMGQGARTIKSTNYFSKNAMKRAGSDGNDTIIQFDSGKIITIDNNKKTYSEMTVEQLQQMMDKATSGMAANKEQMDAMRKMMGQTSDSITVTKEGPGETIAGYATVKYTITGMMNMEIWAAPELKVPGLYYDAMKLRAPRNPMFDMGKMYDEFKKIDGMTLKTVMTIKMMNNEMKTTKVVDSVEKTPVPASIFAIPAGYKQVDAGLAK